MMTNKELAKKLRSTYELWKKDSLNNSGYFIIFNGFVENKKLENISGNALKLYIYLGVYANNNTGEVWHSNKTIAKYFHKSERTIRLWIQELEGLNLIRRMQLEYNGEPHVFLQPYSTSNYENSNKYVYTYRLKNKEYREKIDLQIISNELEEIIEKYIKNSYVYVKKNTFTITTYSPISTSVLRNINNIIRKNKPEIPMLISTYANTNFEIEQGRDYLFERIRKTT